MVTKEDIQDISNDNNNSMQRKISWIYKKKSRKRVDLEAIVKLSYAVYKDIRKLKPIYRRIYPWVNFYANYYVQKHRLYIDNREICVRLISL
jgi:hypothetical protein